MNFAFPRRISLGGKKELLHAQVYSPSRSMDISLFLGHAFCLAEGRAAAAPVG